MKSYNFLKKNSVAVDKSTRVYIHKTNQPTNQATNQLTNQSNYDNEFSSYNVGLLINETECVKYFIINLIPNHIYLL